MLGATDASRPERQAVTALYDPNSRVCIRVADCQGDARFARILSATARPLIRPCYALVKVVPSASTTAQDSVSPSSEAASFLGTSRAFDLTGMGRKCPYGLSR